MSARKPMAKRTASNRTPADAAPSAALAKQNSALHVQAELGKSGAFDRPITTEITALTKFYPAENYHRDYYANNPEQGYCQMVIRPKVEKFRKAFANKLK